MQRKTQYKRPIYQASSTQSHALEKPESIDLVEAEKSRHQKAKYRLMVVNTTALNLFTLKKLPIPLNIWLLIVPENAWRPETTITYSFQVPVGNAEAAMFMSYQPPEYVNGTIPVAPLSTSNAAMIRNQLAWWQQAISLRYVESNDQPMLYFFEFTPVHNSTTLGFSLVGTEILKHHPYFSSFGFNRKVINANNTDKQLAINAMVFNHEIGHGMLGFKHPFDPPTFSTDAATNTTQFSVMAYRLPVADDLRPIYSITPMPADLDAAHILYGQNWQSRRNDTTYFLDEFTPYRYPTYASLPWDAGGNDTLSAQHLEEDVQLDIRPYGISKNTRGRVYTPNIDLENVVSSRGKNVIFLNEWNNHVDITQSKQTTLYIDPIACGKDTIIGFDPSRDVIKVITRNESPHLWQIYQSRGDTNTTVIYFDRHNRLELPGVLPEQFNNQTITTDTTQVENAEALRLRNKEVDAALLTAFDLLPRQLSVDFLNAFGAGAALSFVDALTEEMLHYYGIPPNKVEFSRSLVHAAYIIMSGTILTNTVGIITSQFLQLLGFSEQTALTIGNTVTTSLHLLKSFTPIGIAQSAVRLAGNYAGSYFTLWARDKIKAALTPETKEIKHFHPAK